ncbi:SAM-dependent methyltransferase [Nonomuraea sp. NPDC049784]|uniref:SAM-dependent methyltransferase n=1 Tax=Nonomuraea sp. NPDC049784 TaxID=3154361 RepID=UPI00340274FD
MSEHNWAEGIDVEIPNVARIYDYFLGGKDNFQADRDAADRINALSPFVGPTMRENRHFLRRAVSFLADPAGGAIGQFLDIGAGLPTHGNVHEVAQRLNPAARVVYVDNDPVVLAHARALMAEDDKVRVVAGDVRRVEELLAEPDVRDFIDWTQPIGLILIGLLHFVTDEHNPHQIVAMLRDHLPTDSFMALSHGTTDGFAKQLPRGHVGAVAKEYQQANEQTAMRPQAAIARFFDGFDLLPPGLVRLPDWRPDDIGEGLNVEQIGAYGGVARLRPPKVLNAADGA